MAIQGAINRIMGSVAGATIGLSKILGGSDEEVMSKANKNSVKQVKARKTQKTTMRVPKNIGVSGKENK